MTFITVQQEGLDWNPSEDDETKLTAIVRGYEATVATVADEDKNFAWSVKTTSAVSETPELIDANGI